MMLPARPPVALGELDAVSIEMVDSADVLTVGGDDFEMFADLFRVYHSCLGVRELGRVPALPSEGDSD